MERKLEKCVLVIDEALPLGVISNTACILGITLGKHFPEAVGVDVLDKSGQLHPGIIDIPVPILRADKEKLREIREMLYREDFSELFVVDFSNVAQSCNVYGEFIEKAASTVESDFTYLGLGICGGKKLVNKITGSIPLLR